MYDFHTLSPKDFENLTRDLLQEEFNITFESFKNGKDQGIDLRFTKDSANEIIVQCKHYKNSTYSNLINSLRKEVNKISKLNPKRYIISTSLPLTPQNKNDILFICNPYIISTSDIYGLDDLNNLLQKNQTIEKKHFKLWMTSTNILESILHSDKVNESTFKLDEIKEKIERFVKNPSLDIAHKILNKENCVVISGAPGVGKTTLAEMLIWEYILDKYQFINISENISEAFSLFKQNEKQIFYYDDFLGTTNLSKNEDSRLILFINKINKSKNKKMILTTREYILQQKKISYEKINKFDFQKCIIDLKNYTKQIKAEILYSHLYYSDLPFEYISAIINNANYLDIINHPNYNPRIIDYMTMFKRYEEILPEKYFAEFIKNLNNPTEIWCHAFENQIGNKTRSILFAMVTFSKYYLAFDKDDILKISNTICFKLYSENINNLDFKKSINVLDGDFITINNNNNINFANPSIRDFIENYIYKNNLLSNFIELCDRKEQYKWLYDTYFATKRSSLKYAYTFFNKLYSHNLKEYDSNITELIIRIIDIIGNEQLIPKIQASLNHIANDRYELYNNDNVLSNLRTLFFEENEIIINFVNQILQKFRFSIYDIDELDEYISIANFINIWQDVLDEQIVQEITEKVDDNFEHLKEDAIRDWGEDLYYLEDARDKLEEINDKLELFYDLDDINDRIDELQEQEEALSDIMQEEKIIYKSSTYIDNIENEEDNIKDLFNTLEND